MENALPLESDRFPSFQELFYLCTLQRCGSIAAAARALGVDHATVSRRIAHLEKIMGMTLILRSGRSCHLTQHGIEIARLSETMRTVSDSVLRYIEANAGDKAAVVKVNSLPLLATHVIAPSLNTLCMERPDLQIALSGSSHIVSVERGEADIVIGLVRPAAGSVVVSRLSRIAYAIYGSPAYLRRSCEKWDFVTFHERFAHIPQQTWIDGVRGKRRVAFASDDVASQMAAAENGLGVAVLPRLVGDRNENLQRCDGVGPPLGRDLWLSIHSQRKDVPSVRTVIDHVKTVFRRGTHR